MPPRPQRAELRLFAGDREQGNPTGLQMEQEVWLQKAASHMYVQKSLGYTQLPEMEVQFIKLR